MPCFDDGEAAKEGAKERWMNTYNFGRSGRCLSKDADSGSAPELRADQVRSKPCRKQVDVALRRFVGPIHISGAGSDSSACGSSERPTPRSPSQRSIRRWRARLAAQASDRQRDFAAAREMLL